MKAVNAGCVTLGAESAAESMISEYNLQDTPAGIPETAQDEVFIAYKAPEIGEREKLLGEALSLSRHCNPKGWYFIKANHMIFVLFVYS